MNRFVLPWESIRKWMAFVSVVVLPWQTRFVADERWLNGFPWEQGRWSFYVTWIPLLVLVGWCVYEYRMRLVWRPGWRALAIVVAGALLLSRSASVVATAQWMVQVALLGGWVWAMRNTKISSREVCLWFLASLIPVAILACVQWVFQQAPAFSWFGLAKHLPGDLGASIIETTRGRWLRAYGSFPHPNIAGVWLAMGVYVCALLYTEQRARFFAFGALAFAVPLFFTQSRASILALGIGLLTLCFSRVRRDVLRIGVLIGAVCGALSLVYSWVVLPRFVHTAPAEVRSTQERLVAVSQGWELFQLRPWLGSGPNAAGALWYAQHPWLDTHDRATPYIPSHNLFFLAVVEFGLVGLVCSLWCLYRFRAVFKGLSPPVFGAILLLGFFSLFDHALWSWWSGQSLIAVTILLLDTGRSRSLFYPYTN